ncbi:MAG: gluconate 2-dehydrogenase subunit 3 family protein [Acidobacteriota bacterium]|nr:gluconate 2-dehydrogenase subunit 3 family protein [Acidobacteriota bacterium]
MRRRRFVQSMTALSASAGLAQEIPKIETAASVPAATPVARFFSEPEMAALRRLSDMILPAVGDTPGALAAGAPEFLDFLIGKSPVQQRAFYRSGLDALNSRSIAKFGKAFEAVEPEQAESMLAPLHEAWTYDPPQDAFAVFLRDIKADVLTATVNSREWIEVVSKRRRSAGGVGSYWLPAE